MFGAHADPGERGAEGDEDRALGDADADFELAAVLGVELAAGVESADRRLVRELADLGWPQAAVHSRDVSDDGETVTYLFDSTLAIPPRATLAWSDPAAAALAATTLVNDLDLRVTAPNGTVYQPYVLNGANPASTLTIPCTDGWSPAPHL